MSQVILKTQEDAIKHWEIISTELRDLTKSLKEASVDMSRVSALVKKANYLENKLDDLHREFIMKFCQEDVK